MGWSGGTDVAWEVWDAVKDRLKPEEVAEAAQDIILALLRKDWDCLDECEPIMEAAGITYDEDRDERIWPERMKQLGKGCWMIR